MRLSDQVSFVTDVSLQESGVLDRTESIAFGGERRLCSMKKVKQSVMPQWQPPSVSQKNEYLLKWILLTPSIFAKGSIPGWVENDKVMLQPKINGQKTKINATLLAHAVGSPLAVSGWDVVENRAKPSIYAVDAGAVYYFRCASDADANNLAKALHAHCRSDMLAEKGYGFGLAAIEKFTLINE